MVDFSVKATGMSEPDTRAAKFIRPGVTDTSEATRIAGQTEFIKDVGTMGLQAYEGYQIADESKKLQALFEDFRTQREGPIEFASAQANLNNLWQMAEKTGAVTTEDISQAEKLVVDSFNRLKDAQAQGALGVNELNTRITTILREAVNRNPGLEDKLVRYAKSYLELSGASSMMDQMARDEKARTERAQKEDEYYRLEAKKMGVNPDEDNLFRFKVLDRNRKMSEYELFLKSQQVDQAAVKSIVDNPDYSGRVFDGALFTINTGIQAIKSNPKYKSDQERRNALLQLRTSTLNDLRNRFGSEVDNPKVKANIDSFNKIFDFADEELSGKVSADMAENQVRTASNTAKLQLNQFTADAVYSMVGKLPPDVSRAVMFNADNTFTPLAKGFIDAINKQGFGQTKIETTKDTQAVRQLSTVAIKDAIDNPNDQNKVAIANNLIESYFKAGNDPTKSEQERIRWKDEFIYQLAKAGVNKFTTELDTSTRQLAVTDVRDYMDDAIRFAQLNRYADKTPVVRPKDLTIRGFEDGTIYFDSNEDRPAAQRMTKEFGSRINNAIAAMANLQTNGDKKKILSYPAVRELIKTTVTLEKTGIGSRPLGAASSSLDITESDLNVLFGGKEGRTEAQAATGTPSMQVTPQQQKARDDKRLQILYQEREDQRIQGKVDTALEQEIANVEKQLRINK